MPRTFSDPISENLAEQTRGSKAPAEQRWTSQANTPLGNALAQHYQRQTAEIAAREAEEAFNREVEAEAKRMAEEAHRQRVQEAATKLYEQQLASQTAEEPASEPAA